METFLYNFLADFSTPPGDKMPDESSIKHLVSVTNSK
jgi:hypothetical protein